MLFQLKSHKTLFTVHFSLRVEHICNVEEWVVTGVFSTRKTLGVISIVEGGNSARSAKQKTRTKCIKEAGKFIEWMTIYANNGYVCKQAMCNILARFALPVNWLSRIFFYQIYVIRIDRLQLFVFRVSRNTVPDKWRFMGLICSPCASENSLLTFSRRFLSVYTHSSISFYCQDVHKFGVFGATHNCMNKSISRFT